MSEREQYTTQNTVEREPLEGLLHGIESNYPSRNLRRIATLREERLANGLVVEREGKFPVEVIAEYLSNLEKVKPEYFQEVKQLVDQLPSMKPDTKYVVSIPVVGFGGQAEGTIGRTLECFDGQVVSGGLEVNCLVNKPRGVEFDNTEKIIESFGPQNSNLSIVSSKTEVVRRQRARPLMGRIRALQTDSTLYRIYQTFKDNPQAPLPVIMMADDDTEWVSPNALENYYKTFEDNPNIDLIIGDLRFDSSEYPSVFFPDFYIADELMHQLPQFNKTMLNKLSSINRPLNNNEIRIAMANVFSASFTKGLQSNFAFRPEAYALVGGAFDETQDVNEIDSMTRMLAFPALLERRCNIGALGEEVKVISSSRRALLEYLDGERRAPIQQWRSQSFGIKVSDRARLEKPNIVAVVPLKYVESEDLSELNESIQQQLNSTLEEYVLPRRIDGWYSDIIPIYVGALEKTGLTPGTYSLGIFDEESGIKIQVFLKSTPDGLIEKVEQLQERKIFGGGLNVDEIEVTPTQLDGGIIIRPQKEDNRQKVFLRDEVIYGNVVEYKQQKKKMKVLQLPL